MSSRVILIEEAWRGGRNQVGGRGEVALAVESEEDAIEQGLFEFAGLSVTASWAKRRAKSFLAIHLNDAFEARLIEVNEGDRWGREWR